MSLDEMQVVEKGFELAEKACSEASRCLLNLSLAVRDPSPEQIAFFRERAIGLRDEVENMRAMFLR